MKRENQLLFSGYLQRAVGEEYQCHLIHRAFDDFHHDSVIKLTLTPNNTNESN